MKEHFFVLCREQSVIGKFLESEFQDKVDTLRELLGENIDRILHHFSQLDGDRVGSVGFNIGEKKENGLCNTQIFSIPYEPQLGETIDVNSFWRNKN